MQLVLSCNKMKAMRASKEDVVAALADSTIEVRGDGSAIRRPGNAALPKLEDKPRFEKKSSAHAHDGGVISLYRGIPEEQSWTHVKEKIKEKLPEKTSIWFVSEVSEKNECLVVVSPFEGDQEFFGACEIELG